MAGVLAFVKPVARVLNGTLALLSSAIDALVDTAAALAMFFGVRYAERPADEDHRFGLGKGEAIAGFYAGRLACRCGLGARLPIH